MFIIRFRMFMDGYKEYLAIAKYKQRSFLISWCVLLAITLIGLGITIYLVPYYGDYHATWYNNIIFENGLWESSQAISLLLASLILGFGLLQKPLCNSPRPYIIAPLFFAVLFFMGAGEEDSWGLNGIAPHPAIYTPNNLHHYFNLSNIVYLALRFLILFYGIIFPLLVFFFKPVAYIMDKYNIPLPHAAFVPFMILAILMVQPWTLTHLFHIQEFPEYWSTNEVLETIFDLSILGAAIYQYRKWKFNQLLESNSNEDPSLRS